MFESRHTQHLFQCKIILEFSISNVRDIGGLTCWWVDLMVVYAFPHIFYNFNPTIHVVRGTRVYYPVILHRIYKEACHHANIAFLHFFISVTSFGRCR